MKSGAAACSLSGRGMGGAEMASGSEEESLNCGASCEAVRVLGMSARAEVKSVGFGLVRREVAMDVWM